jgi:hypothetical protein
VVDCIFEDLLVQGQQLIKSKYRAGGGTNVSYVAIDIKKQVDEEEEFANAVAAVEKGMEKAVAAEQGQEQIENAMADVLEEVEQDVESGAIITEFKPDHIITDPGCIFQLINFIGY